MREDLSEFPIKEATLNIKGLPEKIYFRGILPDLKTTRDRFAIVGARKTTDYGKEQAFRFAKTLAEAGLIIVSGMALGIDSFAHKGALAGKNKTIAILGSGLDEKTIYPKANLSLAKEILEKNGCLISAYGPEQRGFASNFLARNGIIAALSLGVLVVEAKLKSGALNTANWAKKHKKPVFALPGRINDISSAGCNLLIQQGAILTQNPKDVLNFLKIGYDKTNQRKNNDPESKILNVLTKGALTCDEIIEKTKLSTADVLKIISQLELEDKIKNLFSDKYVLN